MEASVAALRLGVGVFTSEVPTGGCPCHDEVSSFDQEGDAPKELEDMNEAEGLDKACSLEVLEWQGFGFVGGYSHRVVPQGLKNPENEEDHHDDKEDQR